MPHLVSHPYEPSKMCRVYSSEEGAALEGAMVQCDMKDCPRHLCAEHGFDHSKPHAYYEIDFECYQSCCWPGRTGFCVPVKGDA